MSDLIPTLSNMTHTTYRPDADAYHSRVQALAAERAELRAADNAVRLARAAWRASTTDENAQRVADLIAARDLIKAAR